MSLQNTPRSNRVHIGIFGLRNSGKSSLVNALTNQDTAIVSDTAGTTTDPVYKSMEIHGIGPCVLIDTAGFDDVGQIGELRIRQTEMIVDKTDIAIMVFDPTQNDGRSLSSYEISWLDKLKKKKITTIGVMNKADLLEQSKAADNSLGRRFSEQVNQICNRIQKETQIPVVPVSAATKKGINELRELLIRSLPADYESSSITGGLAGEGDVVLLVMPQDIQAPKGRLILPQVQVIRELLDKKCIVMSVTTDKLEEGLASLKNPPKLIITDSQVFKTVYDHKPAESMLTSFSVLLAGYKGDLKYFAESAYAVEKLTESSRVLIAEACTHAPLEEDIGRVKIPAMLRKRIGQGLQVDIVSGTDFPADISDYDLIIHCGGCMFNRKHVLSRVEKARQALVPMTNYGVVIAYLSGILEKISIP
jgi:[FeFe] hydrogenase H-cluster maturation GTPase HydF